MAKIRTPVISLFPANAMRFVLLLITSTLHAQNAPRLDSVSPAIGQRGHKYDIALTGDFMTDANRIFISTSGLTISNIQSTAKKVTAKLSVDSEAHLGEGEIRVATPRGVSNAIPFTISTLPQVQDKEPNNSPAQTQTVVLPAEIAGVINGAADEDCYAFNATKGQHLVFEVFAARNGSPLDASIRLIGPDSQEIAWGENEVGFDSRIDHAISADGKYTLLIRDFQYGGGGNHRYRIKAGAFPFVSSVYPMGGKRGTSTSVTFTGRNLGTANKATVVIEPDAKLAPRKVRAAAAAGPSNSIDFDVSDIDEHLENEPNDKVEQATTVQLPGVFNGRIDKLGDVDVFRFKTDKHKSLTFEVFARRLGSPLDAHLQVGDSNGARLAENDDAAGADARLTYNGFAEGKEYTVTIRDLIGQGGADYGYRIVVKPAQLSQDFAVRFIPDTIRVSRGSHTSVWCEVVRSGGFKGDVSLSFDNLPEGVKCPPVLMPGQEKTSGAFTLSASADAELGTIALKVFARGRIAEKEVVRTAVAEVDSRITEHAFLTVTAKPPFTVQPEGYKTDEELKSIKREIAGLSSQLNQVTPELKVAQAAWEKTALDGIRWHTIEPFILTADGGVQFRKLEDGSIIAERGPPPDCEYTIKTKTTLTGITALLLETIPDASLGAGKGPGRSGDGNFVLSRFELQAAPAASPDKVEVIKLGDAVADFSQGGYPVKNSIDGKDETGWAVAPQQGLYHKALYIVESPFGHNGGTEIILSMVHRSVHKKFHVGRFRISLGTMSKPVLSPTDNTDGLYESLISALKVASDKRSPEQQKKIDNHYRSIAPHLVEIRNRIDQLKSQQVAFPPVAQKAKGVDLGIGVIRNGFEGDITITVEGYSSGRDARTKNPTPITRDFKVQPLQLTSGKCFGKLRLNSNANAELGTRMATLKAEARIDNQTYVEYSRAFPLEINTAVAGKEPSKWKGEAVEAVSKLPELVQGIDYKYYEGAWTVIPDFEKLTPTRSGNLKSFELLDARPDNYGFVYTAYIDVPKDGDYTFFTTSDDGSLLYIGEYLIVDNDGAHAAEEKSGNVKLKKGKHPLRVMFFEAGGDASLAVHWKGPGMAKQNIPATALFREKK